MEFGHNELFNGQDARISKGYEVFWTACDEQSKYTFVIFLFYLFYT
jgi:hypothetical protein